MKLSTKIILSALASATLIVLISQRPEKQSKQETTFHNVSTASTTHSFTNRLAREKSPYLRQHQYNPVDWYPWGEEAFAKARAEDKPIFLSIGYSTCHWCHVMERESFEDEEIAAYLNEHFVSIKVDREERPDVDKIYMAFVQATTGGGGWPMNVWITADLKPFFGGTYFPPESLQGRPSFRQILERVQELWTTQRADLISSSETITAQLQEHMAKSQSNVIKLLPSIRENAAEIFMDDYDSVYGGFGRAPKFPRPSQPAFLLGYGVRAKNNDAVEMVLNTARMMARGGIYDHIGGGFARYSVDAKWLVPHFEKMLYDNAQLVNLFLDAYLVSEDEAFLNVAQDVLRYVFRDMTHPDGGFYSAEDADSEGKEGKFYCWTEEELKDILSEEEFLVVSDYYSITPNGNFIDHSDPNPLPDLNVLSIVNPNISEYKKAVLESARAKMFTVREERVRPHLDDKVLASWNGMMLGAVARIYGVTGDAQYLDAAEKNLAFLQSQLWDANTRTLYHRWRDGERDDVQLLVAYAYLLDGVIDFYQATLNPEHLQFAVDLAETMIEKFYDTEGHGFWQNEADDHLIMRIKDDYDGAEPAGNSVAIHSLLRLAAITDRVDLKEPAAKSLELFAERLVSLPQALPQMLQALELVLNEPKRAVIAGDPSSPETQKMIRAANRVYNPEKVILGTVGAVEPFAKTLPLKDDQPTAYVCTGTECQPPTNDAEQLIKLLRL